MTHPPSRSGRKPAISRRARLTLSLLAMVIALLTCGLACGGIRVTAPILSNAPASAIKLEITFGHVPWTDSNIHVLVQFLDSSGRQVILGGGQTLTCNGVPFPRPLGASSIAVPLQPPADAYTFVYTDESHHQTTVIIPAYPNSIKILSPPANAIVPIPTPKDGQHAPLAPTPTPGPRPSDQTASLVVQYTMPQLPSEAEVHVVSDAICGDIGVSSNCGMVQGSHPIATGKDFAETNSMTISDEWQPLGRGFDSFQPGPGVILLSVYIRCASSSADFAGVDVVLNGEFGVPITWVRP